MRCLFSKTRQHCSCRGSFCHPGRVPPLRAGRPWTPSPAPSASDTASTFLTWVTASSSTTRTLTNEQVIYQNQKTLFVPRRAIRIHPWWPWKWNCFPPCSHMWLSFLLIVPRRNLWDFLLPSVIMGLGWSQLWKASWDFYDLHELYVETCSTREGCASDSAWVGFDELIRCCGHQICRLEAKVSDCTHGGDRDISSSDRPGSCAQRSMCITEFENNGLQWSEISVTLQELQLFKLVLWCDLQVSAVSFVFVLKSRCIFGVLLM